MTDGQIFPLAPKGLPLEYHPAEVSNLRRYDDHLRDILHTIRRLEAQQVRIDERTNAANATIRLGHKAQHACDLLASQIAKAKALAFVNDDGVDVRGLESKLSDAKNELKAAISDATSSEIALELLEKKSAKNAEMMKALRNDLTEAERKWLNARQQILFEEFRRRFHELHDTVALLLALEVHPSFDVPGSMVRYRPGADMLGRLADALPYKGPYRYSPDWVHINDRFAFPGFRIAEQRLADELSQTKIVQEKAE